MFGVSAEDISWLCDAFEIPRPRRSNSRPVGPLSFVVRSLNEPVPLGPTHNDYGVLLPTELTSYDRETQLGGPSCSKKGNCDKSSDLIGAPAVGCSGQDVRIRATVVNGPQPPFNTGYLDHLIWRADVATIDEFLLFYAIDKYTLRYLAEDHGLQTPPIEWTELSTYEWSYTRRAYLDNQSLHPQVLMRSVDLSEHNITDIRVRGLENSRLRKQRRIQYDWRSVVILHMLCMIFSVQDIAQSAKVTPAFVRRVCKDASVGRIITLDKLDRPKKNLRVSFRDVAWLNMLLIRRENGQMDRALKFEQIETARYSQDGATAYRTLMLSAWLVSASECVASVAALERSLAAVHDWQGADGVIRKPKGTTRKRKSNLN